MSEALDIHFPFAGLDVTQAVGKQPNRPAAEGKYARSTVRGVNVRAYDTDNRARGGSRAGLVKYLERRPRDTEYVTQYLGKLVLTEDSPVQPSQSGRKVLLVHVSAGRVFTCPAGEDTWTEVTNNTGETPPLNITGLVRAAPCNQNLFFVDGTNYVYYKSSTDSLETWTATDGDLPEDSDGRRARHICLWRGRIVLSGVLGNPNQLFASKVSDPFDFDYAPAVPVPLDSAWSSSTGPQGLMGDVVTGLIPYTDDLLIIGMDASLAIFRGDPMSGGTLDNVNAGSGIGMAWGEAWCVDPSGVVYFFANRPGVYRFVPGSLPVKMSTAIDSLLLDINTGEYGVRMIWNDRYKSLHTFITLLAEEFDATHYTWESTANAWWQDTFVDPAMNPLCVLAFDGNLPQDRVALIGSWDGYVRSISSDAIDDDGEDIESEVWLGPYLSKLQDVVMVDEIQGLLGANSGDVQFAHFGAATAEEALASTTPYTGTWSAGSNNTDRLRRSWKAAYTQISASVPWALESVRATVTTRGKVPQRNR